MCDRSRRFPTSCATRAAGSLALLSLALATITGCSGALNAGDAPLGSELPDLAPAATASPVEAPTPSLTGLDRSNWSRTTITIERGQVESFPHYTSRYLYDRSTARERGEAPSTSTVLEGAGAPGSTVAEGFSAPVVAAWDLLAFPVRAFMKPPLGAIRNGVRADP